MADKMTFQRNLIGLEDLLLGTGTVSQMRGTTAINVSKINAGNFPYDNSLTIKQKIDSLESVHYVNEDDVPVYVATPNSASDLLLNSVLWIKNISGTERHLYYYDQLVLKFRGTTGNLLLDPAVFDTTADLLRAEFGDADDAVILALTTLINNEAAARAAADDAIALAIVNEINAAFSGIDLGSASRENVGTGPGNVVQLNVDSKLPAVDGSLLTNLPLATIPAGCVVQRIVTESTAVTTYSNLIPRAGAAPANTVGTEIISQAITPKASGNKLLIRFSANAHPQAVTVGAAALVFINGTFVRGTWARVPNRDSTYPVTLAIETEYTTVSGSAVTVSVRVGPTVNAGGIKLNDNSWGSTGKGATLVIEEIKV